MTDRGQTEPEAAKPKPFQGFWTKALLGLGILQVYNIISHHQSILDLSQSIQVIASWWRYLTGLPFDWLNWNLTPIQREVLVLFLFFSAAANVAWYRQHGHTIMYGLLNLLKGQPGSFELRDLQYRRSGSDPRRERSWREEMLIGFLALILFLSLTVTFVSIFRSPGQTGYTAPIIAAVIYLNLVLALHYEITGGILWIMQRYHHRLSLGDVIQKCIIIAVLSVLVLPAYFVGMMITVIANYYRPIFHSLRWLLLVLIADMAARYTLDPLMATIPQIPMPPT